MTLRSRRRRLRVANSPQALETRCLLTADLIPLTQPLQQMSPFFGAAGGNVYFSGDDGTTGQELYVSDGTALSGQVIQDQIPGLNNNWPLYLVDLNDELVYSHRDADGPGWFVTDGTAAGTTRLHSGNSSMLATISSGNLAFTIQSSPRSLWVTDGSVAGTQQLLNFSTSTFDMVDVDGTMYFENSGRIWTSDGTVGGTVQVADPPGSIRALTNVNGELWYTATLNGSSATTRIYRYDAQSGTQIEVEQFDTVSSNIIAPLTVVGDDVYFSVPTLDIGRELHRIDTTTGVTSLVKDINPGSGGSFPRWFAPLGDKLMFSANDGVTGQELWITDGTEAGTTLVKDINAGTGSSIQTFGTAIPNEANIRQIPGGVAILANDGVHGRELWISDGTTAGTKLAFDLNPGADWGVRSPYEFDGDIYFQGDTPAGTQAWKATNFDFTSSNLPPTAEDATLNVVENSDVGTIVGVVDATDPEALPLDFAIASGNALGGFAIDSTTGEITVADSTVLDFESTPTFSLTVEVTDAGGLTDTATITIDLYDINPAVGVPAIIDEIEDLKDDGVLSNGEANPVVNHLSQALKHLDKGKVSKAISKLQQARDEIQDLIDDGDLDSGLGDLLVAAINAQLDELL